MARAARPPRKPIPASLVAQAGGVRAGREGEPQVEFGPSTNDFWQRWEAVFEPSGLFGPGLPFVPVEPERVRTWDFPVGFNYIYTPRSYQPIGFDTLRALANNEALVRECIETRKDQIEKLDWTIKSRDEKNPASDAPRRIDKMLEFWQRPDGRTPFATWLRVAIEDMLVCDAPAWEIRRNRGGDIIGIDNIDGVTIQPLIDETGRSPAAPAPAFLQVIRGRPWRLMSSDVLLYAPRNVRTGSPYGFSPVEQIITIINIALRRQTMHLSQYTSGNVPVGLINAPDGWTPDQIAQYQEWWDSKLSGINENQVQAIWGPSGAKYQAFHPESFMDKQKDEWFARVIFFAFSIAPTPMVERSPNRSSSETLQEAALAEGLAPLTTWTKRFIDGILQRRQGHLDLEFSWSLDETLPAETQDKILSQAVKDGRLTINEARDKVGEDPVEGGDEPMIYLPSGPVLVKDIAAISARAAAPPPPPAAAAAPGDDGEQPPEAAQSGKLPPRANGKQQPPAKKIATPAWLKHEIDPQFARPASFPIADDATRAQVEHIAWHEERKLRERGGDFPVATTAISDLVATQPEVDQAHVDRIVEAIRRGDEIDPPVTVWYQGAVYVIDGHHRSEAHKAAGVSYIEVQKLCEPEEVAEKAGKPFPRQASAPRPGAVESPDREHFYTAWLRFQETRASRR